MDRLGMLVEEVERLIIDEYTNGEEGNWAVAWSGGKDSSALLSLIVNAVHRVPKKQRTRMIYVVMSDTRVENPMLESYMHSQTKALSEYVERYDLPFVVKLVHRKPEDSFFVLTIGRGYFLPLNNGAGKWCTDRLKLRPQNEVYKEIDPTLIAIGTRTGESSNRAASIEKWQTERYFGEHTNIETARTFMPIVDWTVEDVWGYLTSDVMGWTSSIPVRRLYREATGECGLQSPNEMEEKLRLAKMESCGARFGCWLCPVVTSDRSTEEMTDYHGWLKPLTEYREFQAKIYGQYKPLRPAGQPRKERSKELRRWEYINYRVKLITKSGHTRSGRRLKDGQGTITLPARKLLWQQLQATERAVNELRKGVGLEPLNLYTDDDERLIREEWAHDRKNELHLHTNLSGTSIIEVFRFLEGDVTDEEVKEFHERKDKR